MDAVLGVDEVAEVEEEEEQQQEQQQQQQQQQPQRRQRQAVVRVALQVAVPVRRSARLVARRATTAAGV
jgi:transcription initiation factor TFIID subunit TAF12